MELGASTALAAEAGAPKPSAIASKRSKAPIRIAVWISGEAIGSILAPHFEVRPLLLRPATHRMRRSLRATLVLVRYLGMISIRFDLYGRVSDLEEAYRAVDISQDLLL